MNGLREPRRHRAAQAELRSGPQHHLPLPQRETLVQHALQGAVELGVAAARRLGEPRRNQRPWRIVAGSPTVQPARTRLRLRRDSIMTIGVPARAGTRVEVTECRPVANQVPVFVADGQEARARRARRTCGNERNLPVAAMPAKSGSTAGSPRRSARPPPPTASARRRRPAAQTRAARSYRHLPSAGNHYSSDHRAVRRPIDDLPTSTGRASRAVTSGELGGGPGDDLGDQHPRPAVRAHIVRAPNPLVIAALAATRP